MPGPDEDIVMSFRLGTDDFLAFKKVFEGCPMIGVKSPNLLARKLAIDWARGKLKYTDPKDQLAAPEI